VLRGGGEGGWGGGGGGRGGGGGGGGGGGETVVKWRRGKLPREDDGNPVKCQNWTLDTNEKGRKGIGKSTICRRGKTHRQKAGPVVLDRPNNISSKVGERFAFWGSLKGRTAGIVGVHR